MYKIKQIVEVIYQGRWVQGTIVGLPEGETECYIVNCGMSQNLARRAEDNELRMTREYHVMTYHASAGDYLKGKLLEAIHCYDSRCAIKLARQCWSSHKACLYVRNDFGMEFVGTVDEKKKS